MRKFEIDIVRSERKTAIVTVPDGISELEVENWADSHGWELLDIEDCDGVVTWEVDDLVEDKKIDMSLKLDTEAHSYEVESVIEK